MNTPRTRPTDTEFQQMGIVIAETMLPPSPSMILAGSRALADSVLKASPSTVVIERVFAAMVLEGLQEIERLGATVTAGPITRQRRYSDDAKPAPLAQADSLPPSLNSLPQLQEGFRTGSGATATVTVNAPELVAASSGILSHANSLPVRDASFPIHPACGCNITCGYCHWRKEAQKKALGAMKQTSEVAEELAQKRGGAGATAELWKEALAPYAPKPPGVQGSTPGHIRMMADNIIKNNAFLQLLLKKGSK